MKTYNFGEKKEVTVKGKKMPVKQTAKYLKSKQKAIELIESGKYNLDEGDFWILQNTFGDSMLYSGLIITHTGCLKINDAMTGNQKFNPHCASEPVFSAYTQGLVINYVDDEIRVSAEVSASNCKNGYPYAMLDKRLFDRVVLLKSKIAFDGIYSETESEDFSQKEEDLADQRFDPDTGELLVSEESLPITKVGHKVRREPKQQPKLTATAKPVATSPERHEMTYEEALERSVPSKNGLMTLKDLTSFAKDEPSEQRLMEHLKKCVKENTEKEACFVVLRHFQALQRSRQATA